MSVPKVIRDGKVAVIVSPGYGAGWATWADDYDAALFAPDVVAWIEDGKPDAHDALEKFGELYGYTGGLSQATIQWLPEGTRFKVSEYDGSESLTIIDPDYGTVA